VATLWFVGLGLGDAEDVAPRARRVLARAGALFAEEYTSRTAPGTAEALARDAGRPLRWLGRSELEGETPIREALAQHEEVALLVAGDPFVATTHLALRVSVEAWGHDWEYLPNATVLTAVPGLLGLIQYRFGRPVSLPLPDAGFAPRSPLDGIRRNRRLGLHTLVLLDLRPEEGRALTAAEAVGLLAAQDGPPPELFAAATEVGAVARVGRADARAWFGPWERLAESDLGPPLHTLVVPAPELHFEEEAAVRRWRPVGGTLGPR
jgi:diphthine synthase